MAATETIRLANLVGARPGLTPMAVARVLREKGEAVSDGTVLHVYEYLRSTQESAHPARTISERSYKSGQGYEMTRLVDLDGHRIKLVAHRGNSDDYTYAEASRWDGTQWHQVIRLVNDSIGTPGIYNGLGPSYTSWDRDPDKCVKWLQDTCDTALDVVREVIV